MITVPVVETSVTINNSPIKDYTHPDNHIPPTYEMTPGVKPFTVYATNLAISLIKSLENVLLPNCLYTIERREIEEEDNAVKKLMDTIKEGPLEKIEKQVTPKRLLMCGSKTLEISMKVRRNSKSYVYCFGLTLVMSGGMER